MLTDQSNGLGMLEQLAAFFIGTTAAMADPYLALAGAAAGGLLAVNRTLSGVATVAVAFHILVPAGILRHDDWPVDRIVAHVAMQMTAIVAVMAVVVVGLRFVRALGAATK